MLLAVLAAGLTLGFSSSSIASEKAQRQQAAALEDIANSSKEMAKEITKAEKVDPLSQPCGEGNYNKRSSDLCAQWKAADAARSAADATWWSVVLSLLATIGLALTVIFTIKATNAATDSANAAIATLHSGRAWMGLAGWQEGPIAGNLDGKVLTKGQIFNTIFKNFGSSPALKCRIQRHFEIVDFGAVVTSITIPTKSGPSNSTVVATGQMINSYPIYLDDEQAADFIARKTKVVCVFEVVYQDIFEAEKQAPMERTTRLAFVITHLGGKMGRTGNIEEAIDIEPLGHSSVAN